MLYEGTNEYGSWVIGHLMEEDYDDDQLRFLHFLVTEEEHGRFKSGQLLYRDLINSSTECYAIDTNVAIEPIQTWLTSADEIPDDALPSSNFVLPPRTTAASNQYVTKLSGQMADAHMGFPGEITRIKDAFVKLVLSAYRFATMGKDNLDIHQLAYNPASFEINLEVNYEASIFTDEEEIHKLASLAISSLQKEITSGRILDNDKKLTPDILIDSLSKMLEDGNSNAVINHKHVESSVKEMLDGFDKMSSGVGNGYNNIHLLNKNKSEAEALELAHFDKEYHLKIDSINKMVDSMKVAVRDEDTSTHRIQIFKISLKTGVGNAYLKLDETGNIAEVSIRVEKEKLKPRSKFTESLDRQEMIDVTAYAMRLDGKITSLEDLR